MTVAEEAIALVAEYSERPIDGASAFSMRRTPVRTTATR